MDVKLFTFIYIDNEYFKFNSFYNNKEHSL